MNPVYRLYWFLSVANDKKIDRSTIHVLSGFFDFETTNAERLFEVFGKLLSLVNQAEECVSRFPEHIRPVYSESLVPIRNGLARTSISGTWFPESALDPTEMSLLLATAEAAQTAVPEMEMTQIELKEIIAAVRKLREEILGASLSDNLQTEIWMRLTAVLKAIADYKIEGAEGIKKATDAAIGVAFNSEINTPERKNLADQYMRTLGRVLASVATASKAYKYSLLATKAFLQLLDK